MIEVDILCAEGNTLLSPEPHNKASVKDRSHSKASMKDIDDDGECYGVCLDIPPKPHAVRVCSQSFFVCLLTSVLFCFVFHRWLNLACAVLGLEVGGCWILTGLAPL